MTRSVQRFLLALLALPLLAWVEALRPTVGVRKSVTGSA